MKSSNVPILKFLRIIEGEGVRVGLACSHISKRYWCRLTHYWEIIQTTFSKWLLTCSPYTVCNLNKMEKNVIVDYTVVREYPLLMSKWWLILLFPSVIQSEQAWYDLKLRLIYTIQVFACLARQVLMISLWHILYCLNQTYRNLKHVVCKACGKQITCDKVVQYKLHVAFSLGSRGYFFSYHTVSTVLLHLRHFQNGPLEAQRYPWKINVLLTINLCDKFSSLKHPISTLNFSIS